MAQDLTTLLTSTPQGLRYSELIVQLADTLPADAVIAELTAAIARREAVVRYAPSGTGYDDLCFQVVGEPWQEASPEVLMAVMKRIQAQQDTRGDFTNSEDVATLYPALLRKYAVADVDAAVNQLMAEAVCRLWGLASSKYLCLCIRDLCWHTVMTLTADQQLVCCQVRAGTAAAAEAKVQRALPSRTLLGIAPGRVTLQAPGHYSEIPLEHF